MTSTTEADGRRTRWDAHRLTRRRELVDATIHAIREHGAGVGMDDIAAAAGTSKTVFYRHFSDRAGLYRAVLERVNSRLQRDIGAAVSHREVADILADPRPVIAAAVGSYLHLVEEDPHLYRFIVQAPLLPSTERAENAALTTDVSNDIAAQLSRFFQLALRHHGKDYQAADTWAHGLVGMVRAAADHWLSAGGPESGVSRAQLLDQLVAVIWGGLSNPWR